MITGFSLFEVIHFYIYFLLTRNLVDCWPGRFERSFWPRKRWRKSNVCYPLWKKHRQILFRGLHAHVVLCVFAGVMSFTLTVSCLLMFKRGFLPEVMMVYGIRNAFMVFFFTCKHQKCPSRVTFWLATWTQAMGFDKKMNDSFNSLKSGIQDFSGNF